MNLENYLNEPWAYTGSIAMKLHANRLGVKFPPNRRIGNVNVVVDNPAATGHALRRTGYWNFLNGGPPAPGSNHVALINLTNKKRVDLFRFGGNYAPITIQNIRFTKNNVPVVNLKTLLNRKKNVARNANILKPNNRKKTFENIAFLKRLLNIHASPMSSSKKRKSPSPTQSRNMNKTPSPKKRVRAF
jgi:hypothetical protein